MDFKKKMRQRLIIAISYIAVGFALILADTVKEFENSFFVSFGIALVVMGILRLFRYRKITRDTQAMRKQELAEIAADGKTFPVECQFCDTVYEFTPADIKKLLENA